MPPTLTFKLVRNLVCPVPAGVTTGSGGVSDGMTRTFARDFFRNWLRVRAAAEGVSEVFNEVDDRILNLLEDLGEQADGCRFEVGRGRDVVARKLVETGRDVGAVVIACEGAHAIAARSVRDRTSGVPRYAKWQACESDYAACTTENAPRLADSAER